MSTLSQTSEAMIDDVTQHVRELRAQMLTDDHPHHLTIHGSNYLVRVCLTADFMTDCRTCKADLTPNG